MELQNKNLRILAEEVNQLVAAVAEKILKRDETTDSLFQKRLNLEIKEDIEVVIFCIEIMKEISLKNIK
ncbi:MAG: hypothetical protein ACQES4_09595 [Bacillota bacterium]